MKELTDEDVANINEVSGKMCHILNAALRLKERNPNYTLRQAAQLIFQNMERNQPAPAPVPITPKTTQPAAQTTYVKDFLKQAHAKNTAELDAYIKMLNKVSKR